MWLLVPYARDRRWSGRPAWGRYLPIDDIVEERGSWREVEVLGNYAIVLATDTAGQKFGALSGVERLPAGMTLADTLGSLTLAERRQLRDVALSLGYSLDELRAQFGQQVDLSSVRLATFFNFLRQRRLKPRLDVANDLIVLDGAVQVCSPLPVEALNAFPTTSVLDAFDRANSASMGNDWAGSIFGSTSGRIVSNTYGPSADSGNQYSGNIWRYSTAPNGPTTYGPDCEVWYTISSDSSTEGGFELLARADVTLSPDCYSFFGNHGTSSDCSLNRYDNGGFTPLGATFSQGMASGDSVGLECVGSAITAYRKPSGGSWGSLASRTDSTYNSAGYLAVEIQRSSNAHRFNDFGGGTIVTGGGSQDVTGAGAISSAEAFGGDRIVRVFFPTGIPTGETHGTPLPRRRVGPAGIGSSESVGTPRIAVVWAQGIASAEAFGTPRLARLLAAVAVASAETVGAPATARRLSASGIATGEAVGVARVARRLAAQGVSPAEAFGIARAIRILATSGIGTGEAFGGDATVRQVYSITGAGAIASLEAFGTEIVRRVLAAQPASTGETFGTPGLVRIVFPAGVAGAEAFGVAQLRSVRTISSAGGIVSAEAFGGPHLARVLAAIGAATGEAFGAADARRVLAAAGIASEAALGAPAAVRVLGTVGIQTGEAHGQPRLARLLAVTGITAGEAHGTATLTGGVVPEPPQGSFPALLAVSDTLVFEVHVTDEERFALGLADDEVAIAVVSDWRAQ